MIGKTNNGISFGISTAQIVFSREHLVRKNGANLHGDFSFFLLSFFFEIIYAFIGCTMHAQ